MNRMLVILCVLAAPLPLTRAHPPWDDMDALYSSGKYEVILKDAIEKLEKDPDLLDTRLVAAHAALELGDFVRANRHIEAFLTVRPEDDYAKSLQGRIAFEEGRYQDASRVYHSMSQGQGAENAEFADERLRSVERSLDFKDRIDRWFWTTIVASFVMVGFAIFGFARAQRNSCS